MTQQPSALGLPVFEAPPEDGIELEATCSPAPSAVMSGRYEIHSFTAFPFTGPIDDPSTLEPGPAAMTGRKLQAMSMENKTEWCLSAALALAMASGFAAGPSMAEEGTAGMSHACFANHSIVMGKRLAPRPDVVKGRLDSPTCRSVQAAIDASADEATVQAELDQIDANLTRLYLREVPQ